MEPASQIPHMHEPQVRAASSLSTIRLWAPPARTPQNQQDPAPLSPPLASKARGRENTVRAEPREQRERIASALLVDLAGSCTGDHVLSH